MSIALRKFIAPEFIYGTDAALLCGQYFENIGVTKVLVVTDENIRSYPWYAPIVDKLQAHGIASICFDQVTPNPKDHECVSGAYKYLDFRAQAILAIGGGSVMDCAKAIGILVTNGGQVRSYEGVDEIAIATPPLICVPTTAGSAADISQFAIITDTQEAYKMALVSKKLVPDLALIDPALTLTVDFDTTIDTGLDVLAHAIESYVSNAASTFTQLHAKEAICYVLKNLKKLSLDLSNLALRDAMMKASLQAGLSFSNASLGLIHAIAHALGGRYDLAHGELNGILLPAVCAYNQPAAQGAFAEISCLFEGICGYQNGDITSYLTQFIKEIRPNRGLEEQGVNEEGFYALIPKIMKDPCIATNPRDVTDKDIRGIYEGLRTRPTP